MILPGYTHVPLRTAVMAMTALPKAGGSGWRSAVRRSTLPKAEIPNTKGNRMFGWGHMTVASYPVSGLPLHQGGTGS